MSEEHELIRRLTADLDRACRTGGFRDFMPDLMISHFVRQVVPVSFRDNQFHLNQFYQWVRQEYSVPDHVFSRVFSRLAESVSDLKVGLVFPDSFEPSFDTAVVKWLREEFKDVINQEENTAHRGEEAPAKRVKPLSSPPVPPVGSEHWDREIIDGLIDEERHGVSGHPLPSESPPPVSVSAPASRPSAAAVHSSADLRSTLQAELWPVVYEEVREECRKVLRPAVAAELREELREGVERELRNELAARLREELYPRVDEQVKGEIRAAEHARVAAAVRAELEESVREELRRELWPEVREEVKSDLRQLMEPVLREELKAEIRDASLSEKPPIVRPAVCSPDFLEPPPHGEVLPDTEWRMPVSESASADDPPRSRLVAEEQLKIIRRLRQELQLRLREQVLEELSELVRSRQEKEQEEQRRQRLSDPEYCLEKIREFLFPDQPTLWEKVRPLLQVSDWKIIVLLQEEGIPSREQDKLNRARSVIRETLKLKAEIEEEINSVFSEGVPGRVPLRLQNLGKVLAGADQLLDFALKNLTEILSDLAPALSPQVP